MNQKQALRVSSYAEATIRIPTERLEKMLRPGDTVFGHGRFKCSGEKYIVTAVNWWGIWAIPDPEFVARLGCTPMDTKKHEKLKWCHISGVDFCAEEPKHSVQIRTDHFDILHNEAVQEKYPELQAEVQLHDRCSSGSWYYLTFKAFRQHKKYERNMAIGYVSQ